MDCDSEAGAGAPDARGCSDSGRALLAVNGVIVAVGGTYASTHSLAATVVAAGAGLACAALLTWEEVARAKSIRNDPKPIPGLPRMDTVGELTANEGEVAQG